MSIRFIYFDLDDTLLDHTRAERAALQDLHGRHREHMNGCSFDEFHAHYRRINPEIWRAYSSGEIDKEEAKIGRFIRLGEAVPIAESDVVRSLPDAYLERYARHWAPVPGALEAFERLAEIVPVGILTNGFAEIQQAKFRRFPILEETASSVVVSEVVGYMKPDPRIFEHAAHLAGVNASDILYVGDSFRSDVQGGSSAGWQIAWYGASKHDSEMDAENIFEFTDWKRLTAYAESLIG